MSTSSVVSELPAPNTVTAAPPNTSSYAFPLSNGQRRLWFLQQLAPESTNYNVPLQLRFKGDLDVPALEASLNETVRRHEALRTTFPMREGEPVQLVSAPAPTALAMADLSGMERAERGQAARELRQAEALLPFNLVGGPVLRTKLVRLEE